MPKLAQSMTDVAIRNLKPKDKPYRVALGRGLHLQVKPDGSKFWLFRYRFNEKENSLSLKRYPDVSMAQAEAQVREFHQLLAKGTDPSDTRKQVRAEIRLNQANTFKVWGERWWDYWHNGKSARHADYVRRRLELDVYPVIGERPINDIDAYEIVGVIKSIASRGALDIAKRAHQTIGQIYRYAIAHGNESLTKRNPASEIRPSDIIPSRKTQNYARLEIKELPELLRKIDASTSHPTTRLAIKLMALTFVRTSELIQARWEEFDLDNAQWKIPAERMKMRTPHVVPLSRQSLEILELLKPLTGHGPLLFPSQNKFHQPMSNNTILKALAIMGYKGRMTGHGFRGIASTALHEQGFDHQHIELQLAHQERNEVSAAYNYAQYLTQRTQMMQHWADYLDQLRLGGKILDLKRA